MILVERSVLPLLDLARSQLLSNTPSLGVLEAIMDGGSSEVDLHNGVETGLLPKGLGEARAHHLLLSLCQMKLEELAALDRLSSLSNASEAFFLGSSSFFLDANSASRSGILTLRGFALQSRPRSRGESRPRSRGGLGLGHDGEGKE